jgi:GTP-binding protein
VGLPNAGKSTFLAAVSNARPKIADYPFTTLVPNLGVVGVDGAEFVMADIPGLIEGASEGRGLGTQFLAHVERCKVLLHLVDGTSSTITKDYRTIVAELEAYSDMLGDKTRVLALNKVDALDKATITTRRKALEKASGGPVHVISGVSGQGLQDVLRALMADIRAEAPEVSEGPWQP